MNVNQPEEDLKKLKIVLWIDLDYGNQNIVGLRKWVYLVSMSFGHFAITIITLLLMG